MLTTTLYLDIETLPADRRDALAYLYARKHEKAEREGRELDDFDQFVRTTALDGAQVFTFRTRPEPRSSSPRPTIRATSPISPTRCCTV